MATHTFEATPTLVGANVKWKLCYTSPQPDVCGTNNGNYPDVSLTKGSGAQTFQFKIVGDNTGLGITFAKADPVAIKKGEPVGPGTEKQIGPPNGNGGTTLTFVDKNTMPNTNFPAPVVIDYQLNFIDKTGKAVTEIDPEITNGGTQIIVPPGGRPGGGRGEESFAAFLVPAIVGLVAGILLTLLVQRMRK